MLWPVDNLILSLVKDIHIQAEQCNHRFVAQLSTITN
jgi:hypothetical protein